jgi:hypothetical protein
MPIDEERDIPTAAQMKSFRENIVWLAIEEQIKMSLDVTTKDLLAEDDIKLMYRFQGEAKALEDILLLPEVLYEEALSDEQENERGSNDDD